MNMLIVVSLCTFVAVVLLALAILPALVHFWSAVRRAYQTGDLSSERAAPLLRAVYPLVLVMAHYQRRDHHTRRKARLQELLQQAGGPIEIKAEELRAICLLFASVIFLLTLLVLKGLLGASWLICLLLAVGGYFVPILWLRSYVEDRRTAMHRQLPYMIDLVVMAMEAGSLFLDALEIYIRDHQEETLAEEWRLFISEITLGKTRREALHNLAERVGSEDLRSLAVTVAQGEEMGTPLGVLLRVYADGLRLKRTQRAERLAGEAAVRILGPSMLMMGAVVLLILGPILVKYIRGDGLF